MVKFKDVLLKVLLEVSSVTILVDLITVLPDLKLVRLDTTYDLELRVTNTKLYFYDTLLTVGLLFFTAQKSSLVIHL